MAIKWIRYVLSLIILSPVVNLFLHPMNLSGNIGALLFFLILMAITVIGLLKGGGWVFYYIYIMTALSLACMAIIYFIFGGFSGSTWDFLSQTWTFYLYFAVIIVLTIILHRDHALTRPLKSTT